MINIDPSVRASFRTANHGAFVARTEDYTTSNPAYKIASIATNRVIETANLDLPGGYDKETLRDVAGMAGYVDNDISISGRQAEELAHIGRQLLTLNEQGSIQPPLTYFEEQSVTHLVQLVDQTAPRQ